MPIHITRPGRLLLLLLLGCCALSAKAQQVKVRPSGFQMAILRWPYNPVRRAKPRYRTIPPEL
jgi:hypothetical protein